MSRLYPLQETPKSLCNSALSRTQPVQHFTLKVLLSIGISIIGTSGYANECEESLTLEKITLHEYLQKDFEFSVAQFQLDWIAAKRKKYNEPKLLISEKQEAETTFYNFELEVDQAENAYLKSKKAREKACVNTD